MVDVTVDTFWKRVDPAEVDGLDPAAQRALVPYWFDDRFTQEVAAGTTYAVERNGTLIAALLRAGASDEDDDHAAWLTIDGATGIEEDEMVGVLTPEEVATAAAYLSRAQPADWIQRFRAPLGQHLAEVGDREGLDDARAGEVVEDVAKLANLFTKAAKAGQAVIVAVYA